MLKTGIPFRLQDLRNKQGLTQKEVADFLEITQTAYGKIETGNRGLSVEYCIKLAELYQTTCDFILRGIKAENVFVANETGLTNGAIEVLRNISIALKNPFMSDGEHLKEDAIPYVARGTMIDEIIRNEKLANAFTKVFVLALSAERLESYKASKESIDKYISEGWFPAWYALEFLKSNVIKEFTAFLDEWCNQTVNLSIMYGDDDSNDS